MTKFKVVRTWYVEAEKLTAAIENTRKFNHDQVEVFQLTSRRKWDDGLCYTKTFDANDEGVKPK